MTLLFDELPLHDATLSAICIRWDLARCDFQLRLIGGAPHILAFEHFMHIELPRREGWGRSSSILAVSEPQAGVFDIALQSGDTIRVEASNWIFGPE